MYVREREIGSFPKFKTNNESVHLSLGCTKSFLASTEEQMFNVKITAVSLQEIQEIHHA